jgi:hypothetical protein
VEQATTRELNIGVLGMTIGSLHLDFKEISQLDFLDSEPFYVSTAGEHTDVEDIL